ncbi:MAG TPA: patatin-like phospholipase family protein, partial [Burkholderiales bacterium]
GSITAGVLGLKWKKIYGTDSQNSAFMDEFVTPIRKFAHVCVDINAGMTHLLPWGDTPSERVAKAYRAHLFGDATLQDLPDDPPRFVFNATDIKTGSLWRFSKPYMRDYMVGMVQNPTVKLADTVAASSAFPPFLSPAHLKSEYLKFDTPKDEPFHYPPFTTDVLLSDGGVYDNLGLETVWKRYKTVLVSDAGQKIAAEQSPSKEWLLHMIRVLDIIDNQVRSLRYRQLIASYEQKIRAGAYWGIRTKIESYRVRSLNCPYARTKELAEIPTRLTATTDNVQERLINWGYAVCDAALRAFYDQNLSPASDFPYSSTGV